MRFRHLLLLLLVALAAGCESETDQLASSNAGGKGRGGRRGNPAPAPPSTPVAELPGKGLMQHPFLCGSADARGDLQTISLVKQGKVAWSYSLPTFDGRGEQQFFADVHQLSNGNILYACRSGAAIISPDKNVIWKFQCPPGSECHSAQPIGLDRVFLAVNGYPPKVMLINVLTNQTEMENKLPILSPRNRTQFRHVRMTPAGTYLVPRQDFGKVVEYDKAGNEVWSIDSPSCWAAVRLLNGNTLLSGDRAGYVREVNAKGETVWEIAQNSLPGFPSHYVQEASRLANGNTVFCNYDSGAKNSPQVLEVTPDKKVVWALQAWSEPNLGPISSIQLLDQVGAAESFGLQR